MRKITVLGFVAILAIALTGCGSSGSATSTTASDTPTATDISQLPNATSPMASASASVSASKSVYKSASTGLNLLAATSSSFQSTDSLAGCQVANVVKDAIVSAAQADQILCYVQAMSSAFDSVTDAGRAVNVYDGAWHIFNLDIAGEGDNGGPDKVKLQIVKTAGTITSFKMFMCKKDGNNVSTQNEYTSQTLDGTTFAMHARGNFSSAQWSGGHQVDVAGTLNAAGAFTQKTITMKNSGTDGTNANWQEATLTQTPGAFTVSGYQKGQFTGGEGGTGSYQEAAYGTGQLLGDTSTDITTLALGDGAVNVDPVYSGSFQSQAFTFDPAAEAFAWLGDSMEKVLPANGSSYYDAATAGTIPTPAATQFSITFDADQTWDCSDDEATAVSLPEVQNSALQTSCDKYNQDHQWINCFDAIGRQEMEQEQQQ